MAVGTIVRQHGILTSIHAAYLKKRHIEVRILYQNVVLFSIYLPANFPICSKTFQPPHKGGPKRQLICLEVLFQIDIFFKISTLKIPRTAPLACSSSYQLSFGVKNRKKSSSLLLGLFFQKARF